jgi:hypothetical protein
MGTENHSIARQPSVRWVSIDPSDFGDDPNSAENAQHGANRGQKVLYLSLETRHSGYEGDLGSGRRTRTKEDDSRFLVIGCETRTDVAVVGKAKIGARGLRS